MSKQNNEDLRQMQSLPLKVLSLFSGIGAFEKALDNLGASYELTAYCEIDKYASRSYAAIHGVSEDLNLGDITKVDEKALPKDLDLITYGFPCQDISIAGRQKGLIDEDGKQTRSGLFFEALRIIQETQPRVAIAENVKNLTGSKFKEQFALVLRSLEEAGYNNYWKVLNLKDFGIPQNRERVFIVSIRKDIDNGTFTFPTGFPLEKRLKDVLEDEVECRHYKADRTSDFATCVAVAMRGRYNEEGKVVQRFEVSNREYANAITTVQKDSMVSTPYGIRDFTVLERFWLMGFSKIDCGKASCYVSETHLNKQIGNSIGVPCVEHILMALFDCGALAI